MMVTLSEDEGYLVDIFRIRGGNTHDYFIRGGLDEAFTIQFDTELPSADGLVYEFIHLKQRGEVGLPLQAHIEFASGGQRVISRLAEVFGSSPSQLEIFSGVAPAIRRAGTAPFSFVRHSVKDSSEELETCFVWIHEATRGKSRIQGVQAEETQGTVTVTIDLGDRKDVVLSALDPDTEVSVGDLVLKGKLAFASQKGETPTGWVHHGTSLKKKGVQIAGRSPGLKANIVGVLSRQAGDEGDALLIDAPPETAGRGYRLAHIDLGDAIRYSIPITGLEAGEPGTLRVNLSHGPGFRLKNGEIVMTQFPGWKVRSLPSVLLE